MCSIHFPKWKTYSWFVRNIFSKAWYFLSKRIDHLWWKYQTHQYCTGLCRRCSPSRNLYVSKQVNMLSNGSSHANRYLHARDFCVSEGIGATCHGHIDATWIIISFNQAVTIISGHISVKTTDTTSAPEYHCLLGWRPLIVALTSQLYQRRQITLEVLGIEYRSTGRHSGYHIELSTTPRRPLYGASILVHNIHSSTLLCSSALKCLPNQLFIIDINTNKAH